MQYMYVHTWVRVVHVVLQLADSCLGVRSSSNGAYNVTYEVRGDNITFLLQARTTGWVGIGFSLDQLMVGHMCASECRSLQHACHTSAPQRPTTNCRLIQMWLLVQAVIKVHLCMMGEFVAVTTNTVQHWCMQ